MMLIMFGSPLEDSFENKMLLFNETMVAMYLYILTTLTDFNDDADLFDNCGLALLSIVIISFTVNFLKFVYYMLRDIYYRIKRACNKAKETSPDDVVPIKPTVEDISYSSEVTLDGHEMRNKALKRGPNLI